MSWKTVKLGDVLSYEQPTKYIVETDNYDDRNHTPVLTAGKSFILGYTNEVDNIFQDFPVIIFDDFTTAIKYVDFPFKVKSSAMKILKAKDEISDVRYLFHKMSTLKIDKDLHKRYWISKYSQIEIPLPSLPIQKQIAEILDKADALRKKDLELLRHYDALAQSLFIDMFGDPVKNEKGWEKITGKNIFKLVGGAAFKSTDYIANGIPLIRIGTVNKGYFDGAQVVYLAESFLNKYNKYLVYPNDLLVTLTGTVGKDDYGNVFVLDNIFDKYFLNQRVAKIIVPSTFNYVFIQYFFKQREIKSSLIGVERGVRQANIGNEDFYKLNVIAPPIALQNQFAEQIKNIELQKEKVKAQIKASENLFQALLQKMFS